MNQLREETAPAEETASGAGPLSPYASMLLGSFIFAGMGALAHALGGSLDWQIIALTRSVLPLSIVFLLAKLAGVRLVLWRPRTLWMRSIAGSTAIMCTFYALTRLPVSDVMTLTNMFPIWVALLSWPLLGEWPPGYVWVVVASGVAGVVLIQQPHLEVGNWAALVALASSLCTGFAMIGLHRLRDIDPRAIVVHFSGVACLFALGSILIFGSTSHPQHLAPAVIGTLLLGIGLSATVGQLLLTHAFANGSPTKVAVIGLTQIVFALSFDVFFFRHPLRPLSLLGMLLVVAPTAWLMLRRKPTVG
jgi:drug/metabolite transporter (DMT)-like permease